MFVEDANSEITKDPATIMAKVICSTLIFR
nr:MAG TPA: hypothetical protein [Caudoviricetes sp.]